MSIQKVLGLETLHTSYYAYLQSLYGLIFWGNSENEKFIFRLQKRATRVRTLIVATLL
jgi:hypothetical protein